MLDALAIAGSVVSSGSWVVFAYLDPGTGSYVLQVLLAGLLGGAYAVRHFWTGVRAFLRRQPVLRDQELSTAPTAAAGAARTADRRDDARR
jgi:hypothetical protein